MARISLRPIRLAGLIATTAALAATAATAAVGGCHVSGCREGDQACTMLAETTSTADTSGGQTTGAPTSSIDTSSSGASEVTLTEADTSTTPGVCGDAVLDDGEACDDGNAALDDGCLPTCELARCGDGHTFIGVEQCDDGDEDDTDECTSLCKLPRCGDGFVHPPELCDAGEANSDKVYGGCGSNCQPGPGCGDGKLNGPEDCDDENTDPNDGCLVGCIEATSCKQILEVTPGAPSGTYRIWPTALGGGIDLAAYCDMESDGG
ncbi:MAG TPA: fibrinogen-like YCDxxxxGGGW domain-containing protein, partial [Nannocystis sp.]